MNVRDPYDVLGVNRTASDDEIHAAYRTLAKRYHPDLHPNDPTAEARFKEIAGAYELLSDREERARLDREHQAAETSEYAEPGHGYSAERGYTTWSQTRDDAFARDDVRARKRRQINGWLVAFGLWVLISYGNGLLRGFTTELNGTIESIGTVDTPLVYYLFFGGSGSQFASRSDRHNNIYTIRDFDGRSQTFIAGPPCSLLYERPRTGVHIHKEAWQWSYEINGRQVSDFSAPVAPSCALGAPFRLLFGLGPLILGLFWRSRTSFDRASY